MLGISEILRHDNQDLLTKELLFVLCGDEHRNLVHRVELGLDDHLPGVDSERKHLAVGDVQSRDVGPGETVGYKGRNIALISNLY